ncbi:MAG: hypothetical protein K6F52_05475 [Clostridia bacterium]|nr:hypothetical protein [Clostridia bacterium]
MVNNNDKRMTNSKRSCIFKAFLEKLCGDNKEYRRKTEMLSDEESRKKYIIKMQNRNKKRYIILLIAAALFALIFSLQNAFDEPEFVVENGRVTGIRRPYENEKPVTYRLGVFESGKAAGEITFAVNPKIGSDNSDFKENEKNERENRLAQTKNTADDAKREKERKLRLECEKIAKNLTASTDGAFLVLPDSFADGSPLEFREIKGNSAIVYFLALTILSFFIIYSARYKGVENDTKNAREDIEKELPGFINTLVLLLEAGLVLSSAFERAASARRNTPGFKSYFYEQLVLLQEKVTATNSSFVRELTVFSGRSGVREFVRVCGIIADNIELGSELSGKLSAESELLWHSRKKSVVEKGHIAETKLTLPLMILLLVLILVTIAPAMMEM